MKKLIFILPCLLFANVGLFAVPAIPTPIDKTQPDGTILTMLLHGDEFFSYQTTLDGFLITENEHGAFVYATVSQTGDLQPTERIARNENARTADDISFLRSLNVDDDINRLYTAANAKQAQREEAMKGMAPPLRFPTAGMPKTIIILVNFSDKSFVTPNAQTAFTNLSNQQGYSVNGATGSVRDWFKANSFGQFSPEFDVFGPYTLPNDMNYYGEQATYGSFSTTHDARPAQMILDACTLAHNDGVDFSNYDEDNNGQIDNVFVVFAGYNQAEGAPTNTIWPHRWYVTSSNTTGNRVFDGKTLYGYSCTSELRGTSGTTMAAIGTFCHEFGHVLGLPDYYNTSTGGYVLKDWSAMDHGNYCNNSRTPPLYSAYDRFFLGWLTPEQYTGGYKTIYPLSQSGTPGSENQAYIVAASTHNLNGKSPSPSEFFIIEYREKTGWDAYLGNNTTSSNTTATSGLLVWHIDYYSSVWSNNRPNVPSTNGIGHWCVYIQPTDGTSTTTPGNAFTSGSFTPKLWNGTSLSTIISNITKVGSSYMTFGITSAPSNDNCSGAENLECGTQVQGTLTGASPTSSPTYVIDPTKNDVFYSFTADLTGTYTVTLTDFINDKDILLYSDCSSTTDLASSRTNLTTETFSYNCTAGNTYYIRVLDYTGSGSTFNILLSCPAIPTCATLTAPANAATNVLPSGTNLTWNAVTGATGYKVYFGTSSSLTTPVTTQTATTYPTGTLSPNTTYYWKIIPNNALGDASGCEVRSFTTICQTYNTPEEVTVCSGGSHTCPDGTVLTNLTTATSHTNNLHSVYGCDSVVVTNISITSANLSLTKEENVLTANQSGAAYQWYKGCTENPPMTPIEDATEQSYTVTETAYYSVEISYEGCSFYSECIYVPVTGNDVVTNNEIILYPNPATNKLFVIVNSHTTIHKAQIVDITGKTIAEDCQLLSDNSIDISALSQGVYFIKIETDKGFIVDKFIKN
ncbi:MAG: M6 family metalloprotease domain-containing protein [Paludibacter sp.]|nr:M6 family metalloprotease domain-containing protein [Paludibacter sp.]